MARSLVVLLGAGASFDCASRYAVQEDAWRPPLVTELFATAVSPRPRAFAPVLHMYPLAEAAAADIRPAIEEGAEAIEAFLRERLRGSEDVYAQKRYAQVPLYLQHLLYQVGLTDGNGFTTHPDNYDALINAALTLDEVLFITLNYDTLIDQRLSIYQRLDNMDAYVTPRRNWALIKLHGSVNWGRRLAQRTDAAYSNQDVASINSLFERFLSQGIERNIQFRGDDPLQAMRYDGDRTLYYPALSVPLGAEDEVNCPDSHLEVLRKRLSEPHGLNILVIGYSGLDEEVLRLFRESGNFVRSLMVANGSRKAGIDAAEKIRAKFEKGAADPQVPDGGFTSIVAEDDMRAFIERIK